MSKMFCVAALVLSLLFVYGCSDPMQDDPRFRADAKVEETNDTSFMVTEPGEVDLVEVMASNRNAYRASLVKLIKFYTKTGDQTKISWAKRELKSFDAMVKFKYLTAAEIAGPELRAVDLIVEADDLYDEAVKLYEKANAFKIFVDERKLRLALSKFNDLIAMYDTSDKIDDAAYLAGRIHDHFKDYKHAATYYQRTFQWNMDTPYQARSRAAYITDHRLNKKEAALELYKLAYKYEKERYPNNAEYAKKRILELTKPDVKLDNDKTAVPGNVESPSGM